VISKSQGSTLLNWKIIGKKIRDMIVILQRDKNNKKPKSETWLELNLCILFLLLLVLLVIIMGLRCWHSTSPLSQSGGRSVMMIRYVRERHKKATTHKYAKQMAQCFHMYNTFDTFLSSLMFRHSCLICKIFFFSGWSILVD
jgi:flagellar basal body-associated protein FliL